MRDSFQIPDPREVKARTITLGKEFKTTVTVDPYSECERAEHTSQGWHLYWTTDSNGQRVRIVRMCPKEADRIEAKRRQKAARPADDSEDWRNK